MTGEKAHNGNRISAQIHETGKILRTSSIRNYIKLIAITVPMGVLIGISIAAVYELYHLYAHYVEELIHYNSYLLILFPTIGIPIAFILVDKFSTTKSSGGGSHRLLEAFHYEGGRMTLKDTIFEPLAAAVTLGFGGSAGFEGPSLLLGGGIGSLVGQKLKITADEMSIFLISGAAAGVSAIFKAPLTGIMFALEIPYRRDISREAFIPATLASISAYLTAILFLGSEKLFPVLPPYQPTFFFPVHSFIIGLLTAIVGALFVKSHEKLASLRTKLRLNKYVYALIGGAAVGIIGFTIPESIGMGYNTITSMIEGTFQAPTMTFLLLLMFIKILSTSITLTSGGSGGVFIPTLFVGATLGTLYTNIFPNSGGPFLIVAAMAAMIAAANKTLLTSVALVAETTGPSSVIFTLVAAATSYFVSGNISFYGHVQPLEELLEEEEAVHVIYHILKKAKNLDKLNGIRVKDFMWDDPVILNVDMKIVDAINKVKKSRYIEYPVTRQNMLIGSLTLEDLLTSAMDNQSQVIGDLKTLRPTYVSLNETLNDVIPLLVEGKQDCLFVVNDLEKMNIVGLISETDIRLKLLDILTF